MDSRSPVFVPFSGYGEDQDLTYPTPAIAFRVARGDDPVVVWGSGQQGRDFVHIEDCITAMWLAVNKIEDGSGVNIGTGILTTFIEAAQIFLKLDGRSGKVKPMIDKPVGVQSRYCDPTAMKAVLGWEPEISREARIPAGSAASLRPRRYARPRCPGEDQQLNEDHYRHHHHQHSDAPSAISQKTPATTATRTWTSWLSETGRARRAPPNSAAR